jgi:outer membrane protein TolC
MSRFTFPAVLIAFGCGALAIGVSPVSVIAQASPVPRSGLTPDTVRLSVEDAVALAQRMSDEARLSAAQVDVAEAQLALARASGLPQLRINSSYNHVYENARSTAVNAVFNQPNTYSVTAALSQPLFQGGRIRA